MTERAIKHPRARQVDPRTQARLRAALERIRRAEKDLHIDACRLNRGLSLRAPCVWADSRQSSTCWSITLDPTGCDRLRVWDTTEPVPCVHSKPRETVDASLERCSRSSARPRRTFSDSPPTSTHSLMCQGSTRSRDCPNLARGTARGTLPAVPNPFASVNPTHVCDQPRTCANAGTPSGPDSNRAALFFEPRAISPASRGSPAGVRQSVRRQGLTTCSGLRLSEANAAENSWADVCMARTVQHSALRRVTTKSVGVARS